MDRGYVVSQSTIVDLLAAFAAWIRCKRLRLSTLGGFLCTQAGLKDEGSYIRLGTGPLPYRGY
jgi:hypothetical protein